VVTPETELSDAEFLEKVNLDQLLAEIETLLHRIDSNLDYFGNPAGWVPMLSFEANLLAFQNEVDQSIPVLYLAYWLNNAATNLQASLNASVQAKADLEDELVEMINAFNEAQTAIPRLKVESEAIKLRIAAVQVALANKLKELEARARQNLEDRHKVPFWKKALGVLAVAADLVPVGQPTIGRIGSGARPPRPTGRRQAVGERLGHRAQGLRHLFPEEHHRLLRRHEHHLQHLDQQHQESQAGTSSPN